MKIDEMIPTLDDPALATLRVNAQRLSVQGTVKQKDQANAALELIEAESARRAALAPPKKRAVRAKR